MAFADYFRHDYNVISLDIDEVDTASNNQVFIDFLHQFTTF